MHSLRADNDTAFAVSLVGSGLLRDDELGYYVQNGGWVWVGVPTKRSGRQTSREASLAAGTRLELSVLRLAWVPALRVCETIESFFVLIDGSVPGRFKLNSRRSGRGFGSEKSGTNKDRDWWFERFTRSKAVDRKSVV